MKKIVCEVCGSDDIQKIDGVFVCNTCGIKYSLSEVKALLKDDEVDVPQTYTKNVIVSNDKRNENLIKLSIDSFIKCDYENSYKYSSEALIEDPNNYELITIQGLSTLDKSVATHNLPDTYMMLIEQSIKLIESGYPTFENRKENLINVKKYVDSAFSSVTKKLQFEIKKIESKTPKADFVDIMVGINGVIQAIGGNVFTQQTAATYALPTENKNLIINQFSLEKDEIAKFVNEIRKLYDKINKLLTSKIEFYTNEINRVAKERLEEKKRIADEEEAERKKERYEYFANHQEEKEILLNEVSKLEKELENYRKIKAEKESSYTALNDNIRYYSCPERIEGKKIDDKLHDLYLEKESLSILQKKRREELEKEISLLRNKKLPYQELIKLEDEYRENKRIELNEMRAIIQDADEKIRNISEKLDKLKFDLAINE